ncbi:MAG: DUF4147 domain-containing protein [Angelakisella sp.]|nr:DUF4147 domain-containing protein [Angelakisella sp.]
MGDPAFFKNQEQLLSHGDIPLRRDALAIIEAGIASVIPYQATKELIRLEGEDIFVGGDRYTKVRNIYVVGVGKGAFPIAQALDERLGARIRQGVVVVKEGEKRRLPHIEVFESSHPYPDERSVTGANKIHKILQEAGEGDLIFAAVTGGSSALVNLPAGGITIQELQAVHQMLLACGATIGKINTVRKHLCRLKGGQMVAYGQPATVITLTLDTAQPDMPWPDLSLPDPTTFQDAIDVLHTYKLWDKAPASVRNHLLGGLEHPQWETVKSFAGMHQALYGVVNLQTACEAAAKRARQLGYTPYILASVLEGEAKDLGIILAGITNEIHRFGRPFQPPCVLISGGETTVTLGEAPGAGGPNQETALGYAAKLQAKEGVVFASIDTDGTDGPCAIAGGIVDTQTKARLEGEQIDLLSTLVHHNSSAALTALGDALLTGHTGTNMMNLRVAIIGKKEGASI